jgi:hypothetical protein
MNPVGKPAVTVAGTSTEILPARVARQFAVIQSASGNTEVIFLGFGEAAVLNQGTKLEPGDSYQIDADVMVEVAVNGISATGGQTVYVTD